MKLKHLILGFLTVASLCAGCKKEDPTPQEASMTLTPASLSFDIAPTTGQTVVVNSTRDWRVENVPDWITVSIDGTDIEGVVQSVGEKTVTIECKENTDTERMGQVLFNGGSIANKTLTVYQNGKPAVQGDGTKENPFNATEAIAKAKEIGQTASTEYYYIKGYISSISSVETTFGNASFHIVNKQGEAETDSTKFYCFQVKFLGGSSFTDENQIKVGDEVVMHAQIVNFMGNTPETTGKGACYIYLLNGQGGGEVDPTKAESKTVSEFITLADKNTYYKLKGMISGFNSNYCSFDLTDSTGTIYVYSLDATSKAKYKDSLKNGQTVTVSAKYDFFTQQSKHEAVKAVILDLYTPQKQIITTDKISDIFAASANDSIILNNALVVAAAKTSYLVTDSQGQDYVLVFQKTVGFDTAVSVGDIVNVSAHKEIYKNTTQLCTPKTTIVSSGTAVTWPKPEDITSTFDTFTSSKVKYVSFTGTLTISGNYYNVNVNGASTQIGSIMANDDLIPLANIPNTTFEGYYLYTVNQYVNTIFTKSKSSADPYLNVSPLTIKAIAAASTKTITINSNVDWTASCDNPDFTLDITSGNGNGTISVTCPENKEAAARTVNITVSTEAAAPTQSYTVVLTQSAAGAAEYILQFTKNTANTAYSTMYDVKINDINWKAPGNQSFEPDATYGGKIKIGGKLSSATERVIYSKDPVGGQLNTITFRHGSGDSQITVNSLTISSYKTAADAESGSNALATKDVTYKNNDESSITVSGDDWNGRYIRIVYNMSSSAPSSNKGIILFYVKFEY